MQVSDLRWYIADAMKREMGIVLPTAHNRPDIVRALHTYHTPLREYARNVTRLLNEEPYRPADPDGFRHIHRELAAAYLKGQPITLTIRENVNPSLLNARERQLIAERGALNGRPVQRRVIGTPDASSPSGRAQRTQG